MRDLIAAVATLVFMLAVAGLMVHSAVLVLGGGSFPWLFAWLVPLVPAAGVMALVDAPTPLWEKQDG